MRIKLWVLGLVFLFVSCGNKKGMAKGNILPADKMQIVMWDMFKADAFTERFLKPDSSKNASVENAVLQQKIFDLHKIRKEDYYSSYEYYTTHPDMMRMMLDSMISKADRERGKLMEERYSGSHPK